MKNFIFFLLIMVLTSCASIKEENKQEIKDSYIPEKKESLKFIRPAPKNMNDGEFDIALTGDIMVGRRMKGLIEKYGYSYPFTHVKDILLSSNIAFGNLEAPLVYSGRQDELVKNGKKSVYLYSDENVGYELAAAGFNILSLANNHSLDYGEDALIQTMEILNRNYISYCGVWKGNKGLPNAPCIIETEGTKVGFLCYSGVSNEQFESGAKTYGTIPALISVIAKDTANARKNLDILVVYLHFGTEYQPVSAAQRILARKIIDAGADLVIASHTHIFQDIEKYKDKYIFYGLGNFIFDQLKEETKNSAIVKVKVKNKKIDSASIIPIYSDNFRPETVSDEKARSFAEGLILNGVSVEEILHKK